MNQGNSTVLSVRVHFVPAVAICALLAFLVAPALASAAGYVINGTGDSSTKVDCESATGECTLRGAIEASNGHSHATPDTITFEETTFEGAAPGATITIGSSLPPIGQAVTIRALSNGGQCLTGWTPVKGPCAEITGLGSTESPLIVEAAGVTVEGLAIEGGRDGILVKGGATGFIARDDWFGVGLNRGGGVANARAGIFLEPGADGATIGGEIAAARNDFTHAETGVEALGASDATIRGNWFGLLPDGKYLASASLRAGVHILDYKGVTPRVKAEGDKVGGELTPAAAGTAACDGACNAFATVNGVAVDLGGDGLMAGNEIAAASGPTTIQGNYIGLSPDGTEAIGQTEEAIAAVRTRQGEAGPGGVTIGGAESAKLGNYIDRSEVGVYGEGAAGLTVAGNQIGYAYGGARVDPARTAIFAESLPEAALISGNKINAERSTGIETYGVGSTISGNEVVEGSPQIIVGGDDGGVGNLITKNVVKNAERFGIRLENGGNVVTGNQVIDAHAFGISISEEHEPATRNRIGGDGPGEPNTVEKTGEGSTEEAAAILISGYEANLNEVRANTGSANKGPFIFLSGERNEEHPNKDIQPPAFATALQSSASGTAAANATVRIFSKADATPGELGTLLAVVKADASGNWKATYAKQAVGGLVAATQTSAEGGTSQVSGPKAAAADPEEPSGGGGSGGTITSAPTTAPPAPQPPAPAPTKPEVKITKGPKKTSEATKATFRFRAEPAAAATFECKLDGAKWAKCSSPKTYKGLEPGRHTFRVRAKANGLTGPVTKYRFTIEG